MKLLVVVLNANDKLEEVLEGLIETGVTGATVVDSVGMGSIIGDVPLFAGLRSLFRGARPGGWVRRPSIWESPKTVPWRSPTTASWSG